LGVVVQADQLFIIGGFRAQLFDVL
jgi:hypothetical protein